jgi:hypothetical protein
VYQARSARHPAHCAREQHLVPPHFLRRGFQTCGLLDFDDDLLHLSQGRRQPRREAVREQAESGVALLAVAARDPRARRLHALIGGVARETAPALRVQRAARQSCRAPRLLLNVLLAGQPGREPKLHRMRPARSVPVAGLTFLWARAPCPQLQGSRRWRQRGSFRPPVSRRQPPSPATWRRPPLVRPRRWIAKLRGEQHLPLIHR